MVLFVGLALAIIMAVVEFFWNSRKNKHTGHMGETHQVLNLLFIMLNIYIQIFYETFVI